METTGANIKLTASGALLPNVPHRDEAVLGAGGEGGVVNERHVEDLIAVRAGIAGRDAHCLNEEGESVKMIKSNIRA